MLKNSFVILLVSMALLDFTSVNGSSSDSIRTEIKIKNKLGQEARNFVVGEELIFELTVSNIENRSLIYLATGPGHDFIVTQDDVEIWSKYYGVAFPAMIKRSSIGPLETIVLRAVWNGVDNLGKPVSPGEYTITPQLGFFINDEKTVVPESISFVLN